MSSEEELRPEDQKSKDADEHIHPMEGGVLRSVRERVLRRWCLGRLMPRAGLLLALEILIVVIWTLIVAKPYLDLKPSIVPAGREFLSAIQTHQVWENAQECGLCALWFGSIRGGIPAFVDPTASVLHPLIILTTWIWGVVNGSKMALVGVLLIAGLSQWWLGKILGLRPIARVWSGAMAVVGGHIAARMGLGAFSLVVSIGSSALVYPAFVALAHSWSLKRTVVLAATLSVIAVGGTGYIQVGLVFTLPAAIFLVKLERERLLLLIRRFAQAVALAVLFAGPFLVPFLHFLPNIHKDFDISFSSAQPLIYLPLNLVIRDFSYYQTEVLGKPNWPAHFANFIGWIPLLLAVYALFRAKNDDERRAVRFLGAAAFLALWTSSAGPLAWLIKVVQFEPLVNLLAGIRYTSFISSLAVPPILGLAAVGLDRLFDAWNTRLRIGLEGSSNESFALRLDPRWLILIPLVVAVNQAKEFNSRWLVTAKIEPFVWEVVGALQTDELQWVNVPLGEHFFVTPSIQEGLKLSADFFRTWHWKDRAIPKPYLEANRHGPPAGMTEKTVVEGIHIHVASEVSEYAVVEHSDGAKTPCEAEGVGGNLEVTCRISREGALVIQENNWSGWRAYIDGQRAMLQDSPWLSVRLPAGEQTVSFRYRPWDVLLGFGFLIVGIVISVAMWRKAPSALENRDKSLG